MLDLTEKNLQEQMSMPPLEINGRKALLNFDGTDVKALLTFRTFIENKIDTIVNEFYAIQINEAEIAQLISEPATLNRLQGAQRKYVLDLFAGNYDEGYVAALTVITLLLWELLRLFIIGWTKNVQQQLSAPLAPDFGLIFLARQQ